MFNDEKKNVDESLKIMSDLLEEDKQEKAKNDMIIEDLIAKVSSRKKEPTFYNLKEDSEEPVKIPEPVLMDTDKIIEDIKSTDTSKMRIPEFLKDSVDHSKFKGGFKEDSTNESKDYSRSTVVKNGGSLYPDVMVNCISSEGNAKIQVPDWLKNKDAKNTTGSATDEVKETKSKVKPEKAPDVLIPENIKVATLIKDTDDYNDNGVTNIQASIEELEDDIERLNTKVKDTYSKLKGKIDVLQDNLHSTRKTTNTLNKVITLHEIVFALFAATFIMAIILLAVKSVSISRRLSDLEARISEQTYTGYDTNAYTSNDTSANHYTSSVQSHQLKSSNEPVVQTPVTTPEVPVEETLSEPVDTVESVEEPEDTEVSEDDERMSDIERYMTSDNDYDIVSTEQKVFTGKFIHTSTSTNPNGTCNYEATIESDDGFIYSLHANNIDVNNPDSTIMTKQRRQYEIISKVADTLVNSAFRCEFEIDVASCSDGQTRYFINTYKGIGN